LKLALGWGASAQLTFSHLRDPIVLNPLFKT
jgi:hypothetical protein